MEPSGQHVPAQHAFHEQLRKIVRTERHMEAVRKHLMRMQQQVVCELKRGRTSGDPIVDFAMLACRSYDEHIVNTHYRFLSESVEQSPGTLIAVVQHGEWEPENDEPWLLRNIFLAQLRDGHLVLDTKTVRLGIPVKPLYLQYRETVDEGGLDARSTLIDDEWIHAGPLYNEYCEDSKAYSDEDGVARLPLDAVCSVHLHPWDDDVLWNLHSISKEALEHLQKTWTKLHTRHIR